MVRKETIPARGNSQYKCHEAILFKGQQEAGVATAAQARASNRAEVSRRLIRSNGLSLRVERGALEEKGHDLTYTK